jgi:hypothetical protein
VRCVRGRAGDLEEPEDSHEAEHAQKVELRGAPGARHSLRHLDAARERVADAWVPAAGTLHPRALAPWRCLSCTTPHDRVGRGPSQCTTGGSR